MKNEYILERLRCSNEENLSRKYKLSQDEILICLGRQYSKGEYETLGIETKVSKNMFCELDEINWDLLLKDAQDFFIDGATLYRVVTPHMRHRFEFFLDVNYEKLFGYNAKVIKQLKRLESVYVRLSGYKSDIK